MPQESESEKKEKIIKKKAEEKVKKAVMNRDFDDEEQKAIDKIDLGDGAKTLSFKEYQMQKIEEQMQEVERKRWLPSLRKSQCSKRKRSQLWRTSRK